MGSEFRYTGELDLFESARNWKAYWGSVVSGYLGSRVLEVGAGTGSTIRQLGPRRADIWVSLEPDARLAERMRRDRDIGHLPRFVDIRIGTVADLGPTDQFDTALYVDVLEHIEDDRLELERASEHLVEGGHLVVLAPAHQFLFTPFDAAVGHFRRYNRASLLGLTPSSMTPVFSSYLDSVGLLASLGNRLALKSATPSQRQIRFWDAVLVRASRVLDPLTLHRFGKSVLVVWRKSAAA